MSEYRRLKLCLWLPALVLFLVAGKGRGGEPAAFSGQPPVSPHARIRVAIPAPGEGASLREIPDAPIPPFSGESPDANGPEAGDPAPPAGPAIPASPAPAILAIFADRPVTDLDVMRELWHTRGGETLDWLIGRLLLERELSKLDSTVTEAEVDERLGEHLRRLRRNFSHVSEPEGLVRAASGLSLAEYRRRSVWTELALRKVMREALKPSEEELRAYFADKQAAFIQPEGVRMSQVFIAPPGDPADDGMPGPDDWKTAEKQILEAHTRLRMGEDFAEVARGYGAGGQFSRWVRRGELLRELEEAVFSIRPGSFSTPIRTSMGFHIVRSERKVERKSPRFEEVREKVATAYEDDAFVFCAGDFMIKLRNDALKDGTLTFPAGLKPESPPPPPVFPEPEGK